MTEPTTPADDRDLPPRHRWWIYVLLVLVAIGGGLYALSRTDGETSPVTITLVVLAGAAVVALRVLLRRGAYSLGRDLRRRIDDR